MAYGYHRTEERDCHANFRSGEQCCEALYSFSMQHVLSYFVSEGVQSHWQTNVLFFTFVRDENASDTFATNRRRLWNVFQTTPRYTRNMKPINLLPSLVPAPQSPQP